MHCFKKSHLHYSAASETVNNDNTLFHIVQFDPRYNTWIKHIAHGRDQPVYYDTWVGRLQRKADHYLKIRLPNVFHTM